MWVWCNGRWEHVDSAETLFLVACEVHLTPEMADFWHLPLSIYSRHPFRLTIGHKVHGQQLRSSWLNPFPSSLEERDPALDNMSIEAAASNYATSNANKEQRETLRESILNIRLPIEIYNPTVLLRPWGSAVDPDERRYVPWNTTPLTTEELCGFYKNSSEDEKAAMTRYARIIEALRGTEGKEKATLWRSLMECEWTYWQEGGGLTAPANFPRSSQRQTNHASREMDVQPQGIPQLGRNRGFRNPSLFCWMNSAIQLLFEIIPIRDCILRYSIVQTRAPYNPFEVSERMLVSSLQDLLQSLQADDAGPPLDVAYFTHCCEVLDYQTHSRGDYEIRWTGSLNQDPDEFLG
jgi:hypothetical protein